MFEIVLFLSPRLICHLRKDPLFGFALHRFASLCIHSHIRKSLVQPVSVPTNGTMRIQWPAFSSPFPLIIDPAVTSNGRLDIEAALRHDGAPSARDVEHVL